MKLTALANDRAMPTWITHALVEVAQQRVHRMIRQWRATPRGGRSEIEWT